DQDDPLTEDLAAARDIIENRVNQFGVAESLVETSGNDNIVVELPGLSAEDQERALDLIGQQAVLEFRVVRQASNALAAEQLTLDDLEEVAFTGEIVADARAEFMQVPGSASGPVVSFDIQRDYISDFGSFTGGNVNRRM